MSYSRFNQEWASAGVKDAITPAEAQSGWEYIEDRPPTVEQFNRVFSWLDGKDNWLFGQMNEVMAAASITPSADVLTSLRDSIQFLINRGGIVGEIKTVAGRNTPPGCLPCDGRAVSRVTYAALFAAIGTDYGAGNGTTTFNIPDYRGRALVGHDGIGGTRANRLTAASGVDGVLGAAGGSQLLQAHDHNFSQTPHTHPASSVEAGDHLHTGDTDTQGGHIHTGVALDSGAHFHLQGSEAIYSLYGGGSYIGERTVAFQPGPWNSFNNLFSWYQYVRTSTEGVHNHVLSINSAGAHGHLLRLNPAGSHTHPINVSAQVANITFSPSGQGNSQNMPPFLATNVVIFTGVF